MNDERLDHAHTESQDLDDDFGNNLKLLQHHDSLSPSLPFGDPYGFALGHQQHTVHDECVDSPCGRGGPDTGLPVLLAA